MKFSFDCPYCGKEYRNVKASLRGKKARCSCGKIIRLGSADTEQPRSTKTPVPNAKVNVTEKPLVVDDHFSDLDEILSGRGLVNSPAAPATTAKVSGSQRKRPARRPTRPRAVDNYQPEHGPPAEILEPSAKKASTTGATIGLLSVIASATLAFWFGLLIVLIRFMDFEQVPLNRFAETISAMNAGKFGTEKISENIQFGFVTIGWAMWAVALLLMLLAVGQLLNGIFKLFLGKSFLRWIDGLVAGLAIVFVFLVVGGLFLQSSHMSALNRELNQFDVPGAVGESSPQNVVMIRERYRQRNQEFMIVIAIGGVIPLTVFAFSMVRLFTLAGESHGSHP